MMMAQHSVTQQKISVRKLSPVVSRQGYADVGGTAEFSGQLTNHAVRQVLVD